VSKENILEEVFREKEWFLAEVKSYEIRLLIIWNEV